MSQTWSLMLRTSSVNDTEYVGIYRIHKFDVNSNKEAKAKVLELTKKLAASLRRADVYIYALAMPYIMRDGRRVLNGDRMLRNKYTYSAKKILGVTNPNVAFVQGYGPKIAARLEK